MRQVSARYQPHDAVAGAKGRAKAAVEFHNQDEVIVLTATVKGIIPGSRERTIMSTMIEEGDPINKLSQKL
jgi:hypothetical protein